MGKFTRGASASGKGWTIAGRGSACVAALPGTMRHGVPTMDWRNLVLTGFSKFYENEMSKETKQARPCPPVSSGTVSW